MKPAKGEGVNSHQVDGHLLLSSLDSFRGLCTHKYVYNLRELYGL